jgi:hypothetical protein
VYDPGIRSERLELAAHSNSGLLMVAPCGTKRFGLGVIAASLPANSRIELSKTGLKSRMFCIAMENLEVERNISYLSSGEFSERLSESSVKRGSSSMIFIWTFCEARYSALITNSGEPPL